MMDDAIDKMLRVDELLDPDCPFTLPPVWIPTRDRYMGLQTLDLCPALIPHAVLVVDEDQATYYGDAYPDAEQVVIPTSYCEGFGYSVGRARRFILEHAPRQHIIMLDDDLVDARLLSLRGTGVTTKTVSHLPVERRIFGLLLMFAATMEEAFEAVPTAVSGAPQSDVGFLKTFPGEAEAKWRINFQDPYYCYSWRIDRYWDIVGYELDLEKWGRGTIGEDKALAIETLLAGGDLVDVPSIILKSGRQPTTVPRSIECYEKVSRNYLEYPESLFTKPRWNAELGVYDSWNFAWARFRKEHPGRDAVATWR